MSDYYNITESIFQNYGMYNILGKEESEQRLYVTFTCGQGTFVAVLAKLSSEVWFYKFEKRSVLSANE